MVVTAPATARARRLIATKLTHAFGALRVGDVQIAARLVTSSGPVIGMIDHNRHCPVNLFGEHHPDQAVRPGHRPEGQDEIRPCRASIPGMAVRAADQEGDVAGTASIHGAVVRRNPALDSGRPVSSRTIGKLRGATAPARPWLPRRSAALGVVVARFGELAHSDRGNPGWSAQAPAARAGNPRTIPSRDRP